MEEMTLEEAFENITDARIERCKKHNLVDILMIVFVGILCGYKSIEQIQLYATLSESILKKYLIHTLAPVPKTYNRMHRASKHILNLIIRLMEIC